MRRDLISAFSRDLATLLVGRADQMEAEATTAAPLAAMYLAGAIDAYRVLASALDQPGSGRPPASTARHAARVEHDRPGVTLDGWDCTPADLHDDYNEKEEQ